MMVVERTVIHPRWQVQKQQNSAFNLALMELPKPSQHQVPHVLSDHVHLRTGQQLSALGWGSYDSGPSLGGDIFGGLKIESQTFIDGNGCNRANLWNGSIPSGLVCGLNEIQKASCLVDSGGPLMLLDMPNYDVRRGDPKFDFLAGINIDGEPCGSPGKPDVYLDIREHLKWIELSIGADGVDK
eukprot:evm.model.scf_1066.3 EVM.evm.TU.scf_1066.3   scf_1066:28479-29919(-)